MATDDGNGEEFDAMVLRLARLYLAVKEINDKQLAILDELGKKLWPSGSRGKDGRRLPSPMPRFISKIEPDEDTGCWNWKGSMQTTGYGGFPFGRRHLAHRWIYQVIRGPLSSALVVDHTCFNKRCVNIAHLEAVTQAENTRRWHAQPRILPDFLPKSGASK